MPVTIHSIPSISSAPGSLRSQQFLAPPTSHKSAKDIPFKPEKDDHMSLNMKRSRNHRHGQHDTHSRRTAAGHRRGPRRCRNQISSTRHHSRSLRKTHSLPSVQPRFDLGTIELLQSPQRRARRWTVPSKASSTQGLATLVPVDDTVSATDPSSAVRLDSNQSPAMITLRRATTTRSRRQSSLTSFPPPKFSRDGSGLLSMFLNSITGYDEAVFHDSIETDRTRLVAQKPRAASTVSRDDIRSSTSVAAPPVQTEVVTVEPRLSYSGPNQAAESIRRCSTRYVSDNVVYEIIWDENCRSSSSDGEAPSPRGQASLLQSRDLIGAETLERRLSKALSQSRRDSMGEDGKRKTSYVPSSELSVQSIWTNPKIARLFREPASGSLPHSKSSKSSKMLASSSTELDVDLSHGAPADGHKKGASTDGVEFFPPLRSRANTNGSGNWEPPSTTGGKYSWRAVEQLGPVAYNPFEEDSGSEAAKSRYGSMIGISSHIKRRSVSAEGHLQRNWEKSIKSRSRRASQAKASDDETTPLLATT